MSGNSTHGGNTTDTTGVPHAGLAVGLTFSFLLLVIIACGVIYKYFPKIRRLVNFGRRESREKAECAAGPQADSQRYSSVVREQPDYTGTGTGTGAGTGAAVHAPVYENLAVQAAAPDASAVPPSRSRDQPEEDWYMQTDSTEDPIYNNYPAFQPSPPDQQEEDVYIVPDTL